MDEYSQRVVDHFENPRNAGVIEEATGVGEIGKPDRGEYIKVYIRVEEGSLADVRYQVKGCAATIACASAMTELVIGRSLDDVMMLTDEDIVEALGGLPESKVESPNLCARGLKTAIADHFQKHVKTGSGGSTV